MCECTNETKKFYELRTFLSCTCFHFFQVVCAICLDSLRAAKKLPCAHLFHLSCLQQWISYHAICPMCRSEILCNPPQPCARVGCPYAVHRDVRNNGGTHCCRGCKTVGNHGGLCERRVVETKRAAIAAAANLEVARKRLAELEDQKARVELEIKRALSTRSTERVATIEAVDIRRAVEKEQRTDNHHDVAASEATEESETRSLAESISVTALLDQPRQHHSLAVV